MKITALSENSKISFRKGLIANELAGKISLVYKFSFAGGKSGMSFGISQMDVLNNAHALMCLREASFTTDEVARLKASRSKDGLDDLNAKLLAAHAIVDQYDRHQMEECETWPLTLCTEIGVDFSGEEAFVHCADYHNQFGFSRGGKMYRYLQGLKGSTLTPEMVRDFKYTLPYGIEQRTHDREHDDVWRRYYNIRQIMRGE